MDWFVSSDKTVALNLDKIINISSGGNQYNLRYGKSECENTNITQEHYFELIEFLELKNKKDENNFGAEYYVKSEVPKSTLEPTPTTPIKDDFVFKDRTEYDALNSEQKQSVKEQAVLNEILEINRHVKCDNCKKNIYIGDTCFVSNMIGSAPLDRYRLEDKIKHPTSSIPIFCSEKCKGD
jgi:hypothetical protein